MKLRLWHFLFLLILLTSCQAQRTKATITILDGEQTYSLSTYERVPANLLSTVGVSLLPVDRLLHLGNSVPLDQPLPEAKVYTLQVRRAIALTLLVGEQTQVLQTSALTVGQALAETGIPLYSSDYINPPAETPLVGPLTVTYRPARELIISAAGQQVSIRSAATSVGQALAEAGMALTGLDYSIPGENEPLPEDGRIRLVRVQETLVLTQKPTAYTTEWQGTADLELDQQAVLQVGEPGLAVSRVRIRYEDGQEFSRQTESESIVRPAKNHIIGYGTRIVIRTLNTPSGPIEYWRALYVYATSYSPCASAAEGCHFGTSSGKLVQRGVVAVVRKWYHYMVGQPIYVPEYGFATIEDVGAGFPDKYWIDLGWTDEQYQPIGGWMTVYFLTPVPANILNPLPIR